MEDKIGFKKKPRIMDPQLAQVVENPGGSRPGGKAGGHKPGSSSRTACHTGIRVVSGRAKNTSPDVADHISRQLKAVYDDILSQPVPPRLLDLLSKLDDNGGR